MLITLFSSFKENSTGLSGNLAAISNNFFAGSVILPSFLTATVVLALIEISRGDTEITNDKIYDLRQFMGFSPLSETACRCKCTAETVLTPEQEQLITNLEDKIIFLQTQIDELRGLHDPQKVYRVKTDSGLL